jgi:hypothetical protein
MSYVQPYATGDVIQMTHYDDTTKSWTYIDVILVAVRWGADGPANWAEVKVLDTSKWKGNCHITLDGGLGAILRPKMRPLTGEEKVNNLYPHKCPQCGSPSYNGITTVDCSAHCGV